LLLSTPVQFGVGYGFYKRAFKVLKQYDSINYNELINIYCIILSRLTTNYLSTLSQHVF
jgi:hypothetical protein